jgi:hypothetical protein
VNGAPVLVPAGRRFTDDDIVFFHGKGRRPLDEVLADIDLVVTGPHASAAIPEELAPFLDPSFTRRLQFDFTDVSTGPVARRWAAIDPHVLYIEDPHPRAVRDANRPRPRDLVGDLRIAFDRLATEPDARPSLAGVDAVRPVTFGYLPVYRRPADATEWQTFADTLERTAANGVDVYEQRRDELVERIVEAKCRRLAGLDPATLTGSEWRSATTLLVLSIHDTMNRTARADGAVCLERAPEDRLPDVVALSNRGDADGEVRGSVDGTLLAAEDVPTLEPAWLRAVATAYRRAFDAWAATDVALNHPYPGGWETRQAGIRLRELAPRTAVRHAGGATAGLTLGAFQNEFRREFLLGEDATAALLRPGADWPGVSEAHVDRIAHRLRAAHDEVRRLGAGLVALP